MVSGYIITAVRSYREALKRSLEDSGRVRIVGTAGHPFQAAQELQALAPEVALLDLPGPEGPLWVREIDRLKPGIRVIVLGLDEAEHELIAWAEAGVAGYVGREASFPELLETIEEAGRAEAPCRSRTTGVRLRRLSAGPQAGWLVRQPERYLTDRERQILHLIGQGLSNQQIARRLFIAVPTTKNHVHNILEKLQVHRRADAVREIRRAGFVQDASRVGGGRAT
jgi:two-component system, NarL family, nitrate/nitrite response regulator NarL